MFLHSMGIDKMCASASLSGNGAAWLLGSSLLLFSTAANAFTCPNGANVDSAARCPFIVQYLSDDGKPDPRVARNLKLAPGKLARSIALIVGISKYKNGRYDIPAAKDDVNDLKSFVINDQGFDEVIVLEEENATIENIRYFLRKYAMDRTNYYEGKVRFLFAYSGHGLAVPFYGDAQQPASRNPSVGLALAAAADEDDYQNLYGLNELRALFNDLAKNTYHFLALINACYGGDLFSLQTPDQSPSVFNGRGAWAITAGPRDKVVYSAKDNHGSLFFQTIIRGVTTGDADHDAWSATQNLPDSVASLKGLVRLGALDSYLSTVMLKSIDKGDLSDDDGNSHHAIGSVEPSDVRASGGFFFFQHPVAPVTAAFEPTEFQAALHQGNGFAPSTNQLSVRVEPLPADRFAGLRARGAPVRGIDVSHAEGKIDWQAVARQNIGFAYIKATQSSSYSDKTFSDNWTAAKAAGIARGAYHVFSFCTDITAQFDAVRRIVPQDDTALPLAVDIELFPGQERSNVGLLSSEAACAKAAGNAAIRERITAFAGMIELTYHQKPILYGNDYVLDTVLTTSATENMNLWRVKYGLRGSAPPPPWTIWQYSQNEKVDGITGRVDMNVLGGGN
jgi:GH25 family lysozyme M1 (1,4-beta-N-acetylmuramidase)